MPRAASYDFRDQLAIVTGGTRGIGAAISLALLRAGAEVIALYRHDTGGAERLRERANLDVRRLETLRLDVSDPESVEAFYRRLDRPLQILVNNAAIRRDGLLPMMAVEAWSEVVDVNLSGVFYMCKYAVRKMMAERDGRIVNIGSPSGIFGVAGQSNYSASKAGVGGLSRALARETATMGITVNCVQPGLIDTEMLADLSPSQRDHLLGGVPMQRPGTGEEVAEAVMFLASDQARYVTGATLDVAGGL